MNDWSQWDRYGEEDDVDAPQKEPSFAFGAVILISLVVVGFAVVLVVSNWFGL